MGICRCGVIDDFGRIGAKLDKEMSQSSKKKYKIVVNLQKNITLKKVLIIVAGLVFIAYLYPIEQFTFDERYPADDVVSESLRLFRDEPTQKLTTKGKGWTYYQAGSGDTTILFLHGMGGSYDIWWQQINYFRNKYKVISVTYPSVKTLLELSDGLLAILEKEKIEKVVVVGSSLGGYLAQYFAVNHPEKVIKISLGNTFAANTENKAKNETLIKVMQWLPEWLVIKTIRGKYNKEVIPAANNHPVTDAFLNELLGSEVTREIFTNRYYCVVDTFTAKIHPKIPIQIIETSNDPLVSKNLREALKANYPQAKVVNLGNIGHFGYLNEPEKYNAVLEEFVRN
jgi:maspardin